MFPNRILSPKNPHQRGAATLVISLTLLFLITLITLYAAKVGVMEQRISGNEYRYKTSFAAAEAGLEQAVARFKKEKTVPASPETGTLETNASFSVAITTTTLPLAPPSDKVYTFTSTGVSADGTGEAIIRQDVAFFPLIAAPPAATIVAAGTVGTGGSFNVAANPNGAGTGQPVSIWSSGNANLGSGAVETCHIGDYTPPPGGGCSIPLSDSTNDFGDIIDNDTTPPFPSDVFEYTFSIPASDWIDVREMAKEVLTDCSSLGPASKGLYWIEDISTACTINAGTVVGSPSNPVILVLDEKELTLNGGAEIYGLVFVFDNPDKASGGQEVKLTGSAIVHGSFIANYDIGPQLTGTMDVVYDEAVIETIGTGLDTAAIGFVPGSWRDF